MPGRPQTTAGLGAKGAARGAAPAKAAGENCSVYVNGLEGEYAAEAHLEALFAPHGRRVEYAATATLRAA